MKMLSKAVKGNVLNLITLNLITLNLITLNLINVLLY